MNELTCETVDEALVAYASDALEPAEGAEVARHLAECRNHDEELHALRSDFSRLAMGITPLTPPPSLRASLLDAFDRDVARSNAEAEPARLQPRQAARRIASAAWFGYALAAALLIVAIGLGAWGVSRGGDADVDVYTTQADGGTLRLTYLRGEGLGIIDVQLPALAANQTYQAWGIDADGNAESLGVLPANQGRVALDGDLRGATAVALSVEPAGGSAAPTSDPILVTALN